MVIYVNAPILKKGRFLHPPFFVLITQAYNYTDQLTDTVPPDYFLG